MLRHELLVNVFDNKTQTKLVIKMMNTEILFQRYDYDMSHYLNRKSSRFFTIVRKIFDSHIFCKIEYKYLFKLSVVFVSKFHFRSTL